MFLNSFFTRLVKAHSLTAHHPDGPVVMRAPPEEAFRNPKEPDIPAFAHDGKGNVIPGEFVQDKHGHLTYKTNLGDFHHGIDAAIARLGKFLEKTPLKGRALDIINEAISKFNQEHVDDRHQIPDASNMAWRKIRATTLPRGIFDQGDETNLPTRTRNGSLMTMYTNKNYQETPMGQFVESYSIPFQKQLLELLTTKYGFGQNEVTRYMDFTKRPYIYARNTAPRVRDSQGNPRFYIVSNDEAHSEDVTDEMRDMAPEGYFPDQTTVHPSEVIHHLPDVFYYPYIDKTGKRKGRDPIGLRNAAEKALEQAFVRGGPESVPDIDFPLNVSGNPLNPQYQNVNLRQAISDPEMRKVLVHDMAHVPAMMALFGRSDQQGGMVRKILNNYMESHGVSETGLSHEDHMEYLRRGNSRTLGHSIFALARASGVGEDEVRSRLTDAKLTPQELENLGVHYSEQLMDQTDRYRKVIEAMANHQSEVNQREVQRPLGEIPTEKYTRPTIAGMPERDEDGGYKRHVLDPHMESYIHHESELIPHEQIPETLTEERMPEEPSPLGVSVAPPLSPPLAAPSPPATRPMGGATPIIPPEAMQFQQIRPDIGRFTPEQFREYMRLAGLQRPVPGAPPQLSEQEARAQRALSDPQQMLLDYYKSEDAHLPLMDRTLKALERAQFHEAELDNEMSSHIQPSLSDPRQLAKYTGLTASEVNEINQSMGDWHRIAKSFNVKPVVVKAIKMNLR